jgi:HK97 family phage prohead protease
MLEYRALSGLEIKSRTIVGRPVVYNSRSEDLGGFVEVIAPQAFSDSMGRDIRALIEHDSSKLLARTASGTLKIFEDDKGLLVEINPPNTRTADELLESIKRGDISGMSFGFSVPLGGDSWDLNSTPELRTVNKAVLHEVTITALPAYKASNVSLAMRSKEAALKAAGMNHMIEHGLMFIEVNKL